MYRQVQKLLIKRTQNCGEEMGNFTNLVYHRITYFLPVKYF